MNLNKYQYTCYNKYINEGKSKETAFYLALMVGMSINGGIISDPKKYIQTHPHALLNWMNFQSSGIRAELLKCI